MLDTRLTELLGCRYPVVQTAMGWIADPKLVASTCNAGGFGFLAGATIPAEQMERDILRTNTQSLAMMLRKCAHRLKCNGHEDLSADVVGLLRRYGLLGSPLRGTETEHG